MYLIGITGMIASGKTSVAKLYKEVGAYTLDADKIGHKLIQREDIKRQVVDAFGKEVLNDKGLVDRGRLGGLVFGDRKNLDKLNLITEKHIASSLRESIMELQDSGYPGIIAVDAALLPKWSIARAMDKIIMVEAPKWQILNRLVRQRGMSQDEAESRIAMQEPIFKNFHPKSSVIVKNNGDFMELKTNAMRIWLEIKSNMK